MDQKNMNINIDNKLVFIDSFHFLGFALDSLVKCLGKNYFYYLSHEFETKVFDLVKEKGFCPYEYRNGFKKFK